jgi:hypothetical protein
MSTSRAFAYYTGVTISGMSKVGNLSISPTNTSGLSQSLSWYNGPDEELGYVICGEQPLGLQPTADGGFASIQFWRSTASTTASYIDLAQFISRRHGSPQEFIFATQATSWLNSNGYWSSYAPSQPWSSLQTIATYLSGYMPEFRNPSFYFYRLDGNGTYINDGGSDMYDGGNFTSPWFISGTQYTSNGSTIGNFPGAINYTNTTPTLVDNNFYYISLGYTQFNGSSQSGTNHPLTVIGSRKETGPVGWQSGGNSGADGGGTLASGQIWGGTLSNGFTTWAYYRQTYNAGDPSHCNLIILLGHVNWASQFGQINSFADPVSNGGNGVYYYTMTASNILAIHTLLSKSGGVQVTLSECQNVVSNFTLRIKQALAF